MEEQMNNKIEETKEETKIPVKNKDKKRMILIVSVIAVIVVLLGVIFFANGTERKLQKQLDLGAKYIDELEYEQALACYMSAVEIDPMSVDAYLGIIEVYIRTGEYDSALEWAEKGYDLTGDERLAEKAEMIKSGNISRWDGQPVRETHIDGSGNIIWWHEFTYDRENRKDSVSHYGADGSLIKTLPITYDENGNELELYDYYRDDGRLIRSVKNYEKGLWISYVQYAEDDETIKNWCLNENDEAGRRIKSIIGYGSHLGSEAEIEKYVEYEYDAQGKVIKDIWHDKNYNLLFYHTREYDEEGKEQKWSDYDADGSLRGYNTYEYDENGKLTKEKRYNGDGTLDFENVYN